MAKLIIWIDNCAGQYECCHNIYQIVTLPSRHKTLKEFIHCFAHVFHFKGGHNSEGRVIKDELKMDLKEERVPTALDCFEANYDGK